MNIEIYYKKWDEKKGKSHELLERAVRQYARENAFPLPEQLELVAVDYKEKPYFQNVKDIQFSISHSGDWWACAISRETVGLDIQKEQKCRADRLARRFFHPLEVTWLEKNGYSHFCKVWAYKESYVKYEGTGMTLPFHQFCFERNESGWRLKKELVDKCQFYEVEVAAGYIAYACISEKGLFRF